MIRAATSHSTATSCSFHIPSDVSKHLSRSRFFLSGGVIHVLTLEESGLFIILPGLSYYSFTLTSTTGHSRANKRPKIPSAIQTPHLTFTGRKPFHISLPQIPCSAISRLRFFPSRQPSSQTEYTAQKSERSQICPFFLLSKATAVSNAGLSAHCEGFPSLLSSVWSQKEAVML